jgi:hypothetical protein
MRVAFAAGAMLLVGTATGLYLDLLAALASPPTGAEILIGALIVVVVGIAGGTFVSVRYITPNSVLHPALGAAVLAAVPVGITLTGDVGLIRVGIVLAAVAIAVTSALVSRSREAPPKTSIERRREG